MSGLNCGDGFGSTFVKGQRLLKTPLAVRSFLPLAQTNSTALRGLIPEAFFALHVQQAHKERCYKTENGERERNTHRKERDIAKVSEKESGKEKKHSSDLRLEARKLVGKLAGTARGKRKAFEREVAIFLGEAARLVQI